MNPYIDGATFIVHADSGDDNNDGISAPLATISQANRMVVPGDGIKIYRASQPYTDRLTTRLAGEPDAPITVWSPDGAVITPENLWSLRSHWHIADLCFAHFNVHVFAVGLDETAAGVRLSGIQMMHGTGTAVNLFRVRDLVMSDCQFLDIRSGVPDKDRNAVNFRIAADDVTILRCAFRGVGSDGVHALPNGHKGEFVGNVVIEDCLFEIPRPYGSEPWHILGNCGENGIDIKYVDGPWLIRDCVFRGFRPTIEGQDASGCGSGSAIRIHYEARNVIIERPRFYDCTTGIKANPNGGAFVGPITVIAPVFEDVEYPMIFEDVTDLTIEENEPMGAIETLRAKADELRAKADEFSIIADELDGIADSLTEADEKADELADLL